MTLHIFNPDHDLALASGLECFTAPHAGRQLRHDLGWLPALWATENDCVLVDDVPHAQRATRHRSVLCRNYISYKQLGTLSFSNIEPWGWNAALCAQLQRCGLQGHADNLLPSKEKLQTIRQLSHRRTAAQLLPMLQNDNTVGETSEYSTMEEVQAQIARYGKAVIKAPWSSSGRGVRFFNSLSSDLSPIPSQNTSFNGWLRNTLLLQGSVMVEPLYTKVKDFGMEFYSDGHGHISYLGLSLFYTSNGAYTGHVIATEQAKREFLRRYVPTLLLDETQQRICQLLGPVFKDKYSGPFGIDMMITRGIEGKKTQGYALHPCVELNLRRTMGHVALALTPKDDDIRYVMRINYFINNYKLQIRKQ